ncbi:MAG: hypothetical protein LiPW39_307 [Parcubacteria group bacterium LiPW_39]|nr:MAG: hypothetical protein LiPW39_307 [Parcubacteria group bacterium LiPW_39]
MNYPTAASCGDIFVILYYFPAHAKNFVQIQGEPSVKNLRAMVGAPQAPWIANLARRALEFFKILSPRGGFFRRFFAAKKAAKYF